MIPTSLGSIISYIPSTTRYTVWYMLRKPLTIQTSKMFQTIDWKKTWYIFIKIKINRGYKVGP